MENKPDEKSKKPSTLIMMAVYLGGGILAFCSLAFGWYFIIPTVILLAIAGVCFYKHKKKQGS